MSIQAGRTIKIIVVDDEPISADDMSDVIRDEFGKSMNVDVRTAYNAKSVIKMVEESPCDILLSDIQMPGMTGLQMVSILREQFPDMRVLFLTGYDDFSFAYEAFRQHAVQYILKTEGNEKYVQIRTMLTNEILRGSTGVTIRHQADVEGKEVENAKKVSEMRRNLENIQLLVRKGSIAEAKNDINEVIAYLTTHSQTENLLAVEAAQSLNAAILSYVNRNGMISLIVEAEHSGAMGTVAYFKKLQELLVNEAEKRIDNTVKSVAELVVKYINSHISENVSTSVLSDVTGYSSGYLSRIFRQEIGMSIHDYVAQTRMNLAKEMLVNTNLKIYEVAKNCGYENTTYFIKIFRISTGITPQDYRLKGKH